MEELEYRTFEDKAGKWGEGPWVDEPDKLQFPDPATGLPCLVKRNDMGCLCGYVGVAEGHPLHGVYHEGLDVHGGITFADFCAGEDDPAHSICHIPGPGEPERVWWLGFDCGHAWDYVPAMAALPDLASSALFTRGTYKTVGYVRDQCAQLAALLAARAKTGAGTDGS
jgi:hypothetical protein